MVTRVCILVGLFIAAMVGVDARSTCCGQHGHAATSQHTEAPAPPTPNQAKQADPCAITTCCASENASDQSTANQPAQTKSTTSALADASCCPEDNCASTVAALGMCQHCPSHCTECPSCAHAPRAYASQTTRESRPISESSPDGAPPPRWDFLADHSVTWRPTPTDRQMREPPPPDVGSRLASICLWTI